MKEYFINLFEYENWANKEIADCIISVDEPSEKILSLISHIINAQTTWLSRIKNEKSNIEVWQIYNKSELSEILNK